MVDSQIARFTPFSAKLAAVFVAFSALVFAPLLSAAEALNVPKWDRFEETLQSSVAYANPVQEASLTATFTSPKGDTRKVYGFWDGGKIWRVRFKPNETGRWSYTTSCSDAKNTGLNN